jgi:hypothetical protein
MGSSARLFRVDSRQDGKRFPGCLKENARPSPCIGGGLFILEVLLAVSKMLNQLGFRITLATLAFCLCLGSQAVLPMSNVVGASLLEVSEIDFDQTEFEEDLLATMVAATIAGLIFSKSGLMNLDFQTANLLPVSPPPKHT